MFVDFSSTGVYDVQFDEDGIVGSEIVIIETHNCDIISKVYVNSITMNVNYLANDTAFAVIKCKLNS